MSQEIKPYDPTKDIEALPQYKWIDDMKRLEWVKRVREIDPGREEWHVRRLKGFGGSEIGALIMARNGEYHPFTSAADIVRGKLLESSPEESKGNLARGSKMEPLARDEYRAILVKRYGDRVKFRDDLFEVAMNYKDKDPSLQWLIGTPDDIVEIDGELQVIDYKVPKPQNLLDYDINGVPFYYSAQLHHYKIILEKCGHKVSKLTLASLNTDSWTIDERDVPISQQMENDVIETGNYYWHDFVLKGDIPPANLEKRATSKVDLPEEILNMVKAYAIAATIANRAKENVDALKKLINEQETCIDTSIDVVNVAMINVQAERTYDEEGLVKEAALQGIPVGDYKKKGKFNDELIFAYLLKQLGAEKVEDDALDFLRDSETLDVAGLVNALRDSHVNTGPYILAEKLTFGVGRGKKRDVMEMKETLDTVGREAISSIYPKVAKAYEVKMNQIDLADETKRNPQKFKLG